MDTQKSRHNNAIQQITDSFSELHKNVITLCNIWAGFTISEISPFNYRRSSRFWLCLFSNDISFWDTNSYLQILLLLELIFTLTQNMHVWLQMSLWFCFKLYVFLIFVYNIFIFTDANTKAAAEVSIREKLTLFSFHLKIFVFFQKLHIECKKIELRMGKKYYPY